MTRRSLAALARGALVALVLAAPAAGQQPPRSAERAVEVRVIEHDEFRWGDAAIGGLVGFGLAVLLGGMIVASDRKKGADP